VLLVEKLVYFQQTAVPLTGETHAGEDVPILARGAMSHLFHTVHEQSYIPHVIRYYFICQVVLFPFILKLFNLFYSMAWTSEGFFQGGGNQANFSKFFHEGRARVAIFVFSHSKLRKKPLFAEIFEIHVAKAPPCPPPCRRP